MKIIFIRIINFKINNIFYLNILTYFINLIYYYELHIDRVTMGIGDWGLGIWDWPIPNPQSPNYNILFRSI